MSLSDIQLLFNRAVGHSYEKKKLLIVFFALALCGIVVVFFRGLAINAGTWVSLSLAFLPIFICSSILLALGIYLIRVYHDEVKRRPFEYLEVLKNSWEILIGSTYFSLPIIMTYLVLWMLMGIFVLLEQLPVIGGFFAVVFAFGPFLLNLGVLTLCLANISLLFFVSPVLAFYGLDGIKTAKILVGKFRNNVFTNIFLASIAILPMLLSFGLLFLAAVMTDTVCADCNRALYAVMQWFFIMIPFTALLSPGVIFFFNFAAEAHVYLQKQVRQRG